VALQTQSDIKIKEYHTWKFGWPRQNAEQLTFNEQWDK
jgi:hypothetical protein